MAWAGRSILEQTRSCRDWLSPDPFAKTTSIFAELAEGNVVFREKAIARLMRAISGCVATHGGYEYNGYYPLDGDYMTFGTQLIDADLGAKLILQWTDPKQILLSRH